MKKQFVLIACGFFFAASFSSCMWRNHHHTSITISDSRDEYELYASYDKNKTRKIQRLLDQELDHAYNASYQNESVDANIILDDHTTFYLKSRPGKLKIVLDKTENSEQSCEKIRSICEDIKEVLEGN